MDKFISKLSLKYDLKQIAGCNDCWFYLIETPANKSYEIICYVNALDIYFALTVSDKFTEESVKSVLAVIFENQNIFSEKFVIRVLNFEDESHKFNHLVVIGSDAHSKYKVELPELHKKTLVAFPAYKCEFTGDEDVDEILALRKNFVKTLKWDRDPSPKILLRFNNTKSKYGSIGKKRKLISKDALLEIVGNLTNETGSFIELENFQGKVRYLVINKEGKFEISFPEDLDQSNILIDKNAVQAWISKFVITGTD